MEFATIVTQRKARTICNIAKSLTYRAGVKRRFERGCLIGFRVWFRHHPNAPREFITETMMGTAK